MLEFNRSTNGFAYTFHYKLAPFEEIIVKMPPVSANKRGINDIGWVADGEVVLYGTLSTDPDDEDVTIWQQIIGSDEINKTVTALKAVNGNTAARIYIKALLN